MVEPKTRGQYRLLSAANSILKDDIVISLEFVTSTVIKVVSEGHKERYFVLGWDDATDRYEVTIYESGSVVAVLVEREFK